MVAELGNEQVRRCSHNRSVHFPADDALLISGYHEAPSNAFHLQQPHTVAVITEAYRNACERQQITPNETVERQIACFHQINGLRQECLSLKGQRLSQAHMECLEEILKRVQFDILDFEYTFIDDDAAVSLAEMLEFYDSTVKLNLSFNKQINIRGWQAIFRAIKNCPSLQILNLRYTSLSERAVPVLTRTLRTQPSLTVLHIENVSLSGKSLLLLVCALKSNAILRELYLGENNLQPSDGIHLHQLIVGNSSIQILDLRNNQLQDSGASHIFDALRHNDALENSALSALVLWNNRLTSKSMEPLARALMENDRLETLNIGSNNLSVDGITALKPALLANTSLQRLGLQATGLDCQCAIVLAECIADNKVLVRVDLRDNAQIGSAGLLALHLAMKMNTSITLLDLDYTCTNINNSKVKEYNEEFRKYFNEIKEFCERNKKIALDKLTVQSEMSKDTKETTAEEIEDGSEASSEEDNEKVVAEVKVPVEKSEKAEKTDGEKLTPPKQSSFELSGKRRRRPVFKLTRSSSLTCAEMVEDLSERIVQMSRSLSSLDEGSFDMEPVINKLSLSNEPSTSSVVAPRELVKSPSLPTLISISLGTESTSTIKRKPRRFSVSTVSASASNPDIYRSVSPRFKVERVTLPGTKLPSQPLEIPETLAIKQANENETGYTSEDSLDYKTKKATVGASSGVECTPSTFNQDAIDSTKTDKNSVVNTLLTKEEVGEVKNVMSSEFSSESHMIVSSQEKNGHFTNDCALSDVVSEIVLAPKVDANSNETYTTSALQRLTVVSNDHFLGGAESLSRSNDILQHSEKTVDQEASRYMGLPSTSTVDLKPTKKISCEFGQLLTEKALGTSKVDDICDRKERLHDDQKLDLCQPFTGEACYHIPESDGPDVSEEHVNMKPSDHSSSAVAVPMASSKKGLLKCQNKISIECKASTSKYNEADEEVIRRIVKDLVNYTVYEVGRDEFVKDLGKFPFRAVHTAGNTVTNAAALSTRYSLKVSNAAFQDDDEKEAVRSVVRRLVREVLSREKEVVQDSLRKKRERIQMGITRELT